MRTSFAITLTTAILTGFTFSSPCAAPNAIPLKEALDKGFIEVVTKGMGDHTGLCIEMSLTSISKKDIQIIIDAGLNLIPDDTSIQSMIVTQKRLLTLSPRAVRKVKLYAMCTEQNDGGPSEEDVFTLGTMAVGNLLEVVQFIDRKKYQASAAQHAIWCITDNSNIGGIYDEANPTVAKELRLLLAKLTGKAPPWYSIEYKQEPDVVFTNEPAVINADFQYTLKEEGLVTFAVYNEAGKMVHAILTDHPEKAGTSTLKVRIEVREFREGTYYVRVTNRGKLVKEKMFEL